MIPRSGLRAAFFIGLLAACKPDPSTSPGDVEAGEGLKKDLCCKSCSAMGSTCEGCTAISQVPGAWNACVDKGFVAKECTNAQCHKDPVKGMVCDCF